MRRYVLVERGGTYRIAKPGWLLWHWWKWYGSRGMYLYEEIYETRLHREAKEKVDKLNAIIDEKYWYQCDRWKVVT